MRFSRKEYYTRYGLTFPGNPGHRFTRSSGGGGFCASLETAAAESPSPSHPPLLFGKSRVVRPENNAFVSSLPTLLNLLQKKFE